MDLKARSCLPSILLHRKLKQQEITEYYCRNAKGNERHVNMAPKGYKNARDENNNTITEPGSDAHLVKWVFEETVKGVHNVMVAEIEKAKNKISNARKFMLERD